MFLRITWHSLGDSPDLPSFLYGCDEVRRVLGYHLQFMLDNAPSKKTFQLSSEYSTLITLHYYYGFRSLPLKEAPTKEDNMYFLITLKSL